MQCLMLFFPLSAGHGVSAGPHEGSWSLGHGRSLQDPLAASLGQEQDAAAHDLGRPEHDLWEGEMCTAVGLKV